VDHPELDLRRDDVAVITDRRYAYLVQDQLPGVRVLAEPAGRNTAAAITLATLALDRPPEDVIIVLPADHLIAPELEGVFRSVIAAAAPELALGAFGIELPLVTLGVTITRPATEYGYLIPDTSRHQGADTGYRLTGYPLKRFQEKPTLAQAIQLRNE